jgi:hypothetical protein
MSTNIKKRIMDVGYDSHEEEKKYIQDNLKCFIDNQGAYRRFCHEEKWHIELEYVGQLRYSVLGYILGHFSLWELYIIFFLNQQDASIKVQNIQKSRKTAIKNINTHESLTKEESVYLKNKVWDLNPIIFGLILEMILLSELFWDSKEKKVIYPDFSNDSQRGIFTIGENYNQGLLAFNCWQF